jgi:hypothetical protein
MTRRWLRETFRCKKGMHLRPWKRFLHVWSSAAQHRETIGVLSNQDTLVLLASLQDVGNCNDGKGP